MLQRLKITEILFTIENKKNQIKKTEKKKKNVWNFKIKDR